MNKPAILGGAPVRDTKISYGRQYIDETDIQAVAEVLRSGYVTCGPKVSEFEAKLCKATGAKYAVAVSNGTAALHIACMAIDLGPGDEIITTPITFAASANCALYCGARPVFADINPETYNISPDAIRACITPATKAVVAVDFTGQAVELDEICRMQQVHDKWIPLVVILAPVITWVIDVNSAVWFNGYIFSHERLILNALLTFVGMVCLIKTPLSPVSRR